MSGREFVYPDIPFADLRSDDTISLLDGVELNQFEADIVAANLPPLVPDTLDRWATRDKLSDMIRPKRFYGTLGKVAVAIMSEPIEVLVHAPGGHNINLEWAKEHTLGFQVFAELRSSGRGIIGTTTNGVIIHQRRPMFNKGRGAYKSSIINNFGEYRRYIEKPYPVDHNVESLISEARKKGIEVVRAAI